MHEAEIKRLRGNLKVSDAASSLVLQPIVKPFPCKSFQSSVATKKKTAPKKTSSGSDPKSKRIVKEKMEAVMDEFKHHELKSGQSDEPVTNPKQAIAIGLSEARKAGAKLPPPPAKKKK